MKLSLNRVGYGILRSSVTDEESKKIKEELTIYPLVVNDYTYGGNSKELPMQLYRFNSTKYYVPKFWGLANFGKVEFIDKHDNPHNYKFTGTLRPYQQDFVSKLYNEIKTNYSCIGCLQTGGGKCHAKDTPILLYSGKIVKVQNIKVGDRLMGDDSTPRTVLSLASGYDQMYDVVLENGEISTFNKEHILCLKTRSGIKEISIVDYLGLENKEDYRLYRNCVRLKSNSVSNRIRFLSTVFGNSKVVYISKKDKKYKNKVIYTIRSLGYNEITRTVGKFTRIRMVKKKLLKFRVVKKNVDKYYGFTLDKNNRYVMGNFIVTHNTVCALSLIEMIGKKTIIIVHKDFLMEQWMKRIQEFLPNSTIGVVKQNRIELDKDIVIGMIQSITQNNHNLNVFDFCIVDECFPYDELVVTEKGPVKIGYLYKMWEEKVCPKVLSYNEIAKTTEYKNITYGWKKQNNELLHITCGTTSFKCTRNHKILTPDGYKEANKLKIGDLITTWESTSTGTAKITEINWIKNEDINVYDIEVEDNHNFIIGKKGGPIVHNCHHIGSKTFSRLMYKIPTRYSLGLSATPKRKDGLTHVIEMFLGRIISNENKLQIEVPQVKILHAEYSSNITPKYTWNKKINIPNLETQISQDERRNQQIIKEILDCAKSDRKILLLSSRRNHCEYLYDKLIGAVGPKTIGLYLGGMKESQLQESNNSDIILATYNMAHEGYDNPTLDTLILSTSKNDVEQACGRILRQKNKNFPLIIDVVDGMQINQYKQRKAFYTKNNYLNNNTQEPFKKKTKNSEEKNVVKKKLLAE
jgi:superfamily II DNA or RNA helicase